MYRRPTPPREIVVNLTAVVQNLHTAMHTEKYLMDDGLNQGLTGSNAAKRKLPPGITKLPSGNYRAQARVQGYHPQSETFPTVKAAKEWREKTQAEMRAGKRSKFPAKTMIDAFDDYADKVSPRKSKPDWERKRLDFYKREFANLPEFCPFTRLTPRTFALCATSAWGRSVRALSCAISTCCATCSASRGRNGSGPRKGRLKAFGCRVTPPRAPAAHFSNDRG